MFIKTTSLNRMLSKNKHHASKPGFSNFIISPGSGWKEFNTGFEKM